MHSLIFCHSKIWMNIYLVENSYKNMKFSTRNKLIKPENARFNKTSEIFFRRKFHCILLLNTSFDVFFLIYKIDPMYAMSYFFSAHINFDLMIRTMLNFKNSL
jgi:hypothetical protein